MNKFSSVPAYSFFKSKKSQNKNNIKIPGPGAYNNKNFKIKKTQGVVFNKFKIYSPQHKTSRIGPGHYDYTEKSFRGGHFFTTSRERTKKDKFINP